MRRKSWRMLVGMTLAIVAATPPPSFGQQPAPTISVATDGKRKINLAGRQRMLSQYMAKSICWAALGVDPEAQRSETKLVHAIFAQTLEDLRAGNPTQNLLPETDPAILSALDVVKSHWGQYGEAVLAGDLAKVDGLNLAVLDKANAAVTLFQRKYGAGTLSAELAAAINVAGRQRMLTQKSSKEFCLLAKGVNPDKQRPQLRATLELFDTSMRNLRDGTLGVGAVHPPVGAIIDQITAAERLWQPLRAIMLRAADGAEITRADIETVARGDVGVLVEVNAIVELYEVVGE